MFKNRPMQRPMITPQGKTISVADKIGNPAAAKQQGTTFEIYDSLPLDGRTTYNFFQGVGARAFPFTNLDTNKLGVGETMTLLYGQLLFVTILATGEVTAITPLSANLNFQQGEIQIVQANQTIMKRTKLQTWSEQYNKDYYSADANVFRFNTDLTLQSQLEFVAQVQLSFGTTTVNSFVQLILEGTGGILAPKVNF